MKIRRSDGNPLNIVSIHEIEERKVADTRGTSFQSQLKLVESRNFEERLQDLVNRIVQQGEKLGEKVDIRELKIYRKLVSEFLDEAVGKSHKFSKQSFLDRRGRHRVYAIVKKINKELEQLTNDVLSGEKDNIEILRRLDDIRGLIMDIIM